MQIELIKKIINPRLIIKTDIMIIEYLNIVSNIFITIGLLTVT